MLSVEKRDTFLILIVGLVLCVEILWLLSDLKILPINVISPRNEEQSIGFVAERINSLRSRRAKSISWYPTVSGEAIHWEDTFLTGGESSARLSLKNTGEVVLGPNTLMRLSKSSLKENEPFRLSLRRGVAEIRSAQTAIDIDLGKRSVRLKPKSKIKFSNVENKEAISVQLEEGTAEVREDGKAVAMQAGGKNKISLSERKELVLDARFPKIGARVQSVGEKTSVKFSWKGLEHGQVELDRSPDFAASTNLSATNGGARTQLSVGKYYWRVRDRNRYSDKSWFIVLPSLVYETRTPSRESAFKVGVPIPFQWKSLEGVTQYRFQISSSQDFSTIEADRILNRPGVRLKGLGKGVFYWRIQARHPEWGELQYSSPIKFFIRKSLDAPKLEGVEILPSESSLNLRWFERLMHFVIPSAHARGEEIRLNFKWTEVVGAVKYRLEISETKEFLKPVKVIESEKTSIEVLLPMRNRYFWRVIGVDEFGIAGAPSSVTALVLRKDPPPARKKMAKKNLEKTPTPQDKKPKKLAAKEKETPKIEPAEIPSVEKEQSLPFRESWQQSNVAVRAGVGGLYSFRNLRTNSYQVERSGLPLNRYQVLVDLWLSQWLFQTRLEYQFIRLNSKDAGISAFQGGVGHPYYGAEILVSGISMGSWFGSFGLRFQRDEILLKDAFEHVRQSRIYSGSILAGIAYQKLWIKNIPVSTSVLVDLSPVGRTRGIGFWVRSRLSATFLLKEVVPEIEFSLRPVYYFIDSARVFQTDFMVTFYLSFFAL